MNKIIENFLDIHKKGIQLNVSTQKQLLSILLISA